MIMKPLSKRVILTDLGEGILGLVHYRGDGAYNIVINEGSTEQNREIALQEAIKNINDYQPRRSFCIKFFE